MTVRNLKSRDSAKKVGHNSNPVFLFLVQNISSTMIYHRIINTSSTTSATSGAETANPSGALVQAFVILFYNCVSSVVACWYLDYHFSSDLVLIQSSLFGIFVILYLLTHVPLRSCVTNIKVV
jgi:hypothetical protein